MPASKLSGRRTKVGTRTASEYRPDVVILDWLMRDGGLGLARRLLTVHQMNGRLIMLTGLLDTRDRDAAISVGITHYFVKPPDTAELIAAVRSVAQRHRCVPG